MSATPTRDRRIFPGVTSNDTTANAAPPDLVRLTEAHQHRAWATPRYCRRLVAEHRINSWKVGRVVLVSLAELDALAAAGHRPAGGAA